MAKEAYATITIKVAQNEYVSVGEKLDLKQFTKEQLQHLYDAGALELREVVGPDTTVVATEETKKEEEPKKKA